MTNKVWGWLITVELPGRETPEVYVAAIASGPLAVQAVKMHLRGVEGAIVKVKSPLTQRLYIGLGLNPGEVKRGVRGPKERPRDTKQLGKSKKEAPAAHAQTSDRNTKKMRG